MKKTNLIAVLAITAISAVPLMAHQLDNAFIDKELLTEVNTIAKTDLQVNYNNQLSENVKKDLKAIKNLNEEYNKFLNASTIIRHDSELHKLGMAVQGITNKHIRDAYRTTINSTKYSFKGKELSLYETYLLFSPEMQSGIEFLVFNEIATPTVTVDKEVIKNLNVQHNKFITFMENSANLQKLSDEFLAQNILMELDDLGRELNNLSESDFKDSYIKTLNTVKYYFAYNNEVYTLEDLFNFAQQRAGSVYWEGLRGINSLFHNNKCSKELKGIEAVKIERQSIFDDPCLKSVLEGFQNNANAGK